VPAGIAVACLLLAVGGDGIRLLARYERMGLEDGELWRLVSAHLVHLGWGHLWPNLAALALLALLLDDLLTPFEWLATALAGALAIDLGLFLVDRGVVWYVGLSGVLHSFAAIGSLRLIRARPALGTVLAFGLGTKLLYEQRFGPLPFTADAAGGPVIVAAHLYGAAGGVLVGAAVAVRRRLGTRL
jgi:rhomboid family GlyGly-CTERM serine protease